MSTALDKSASRPTVSIVMPSFNQAAFLAEALDSILDQGYPDLEVLVIDGGSTDGSVAILESYGDRIAYVSESDEGQSDAINKGFAKASGEIVAWLNSDDRYCAGAIDHAVRALEAEPGATMVYGEAELIDVHGEFLTRFEATQAFDLWKLIHVSDFIMQPSVFMRRYALMAVGCLDKSLEYGMDWDLWIRLACRGPVLRVEHVLAQTREYEATKTSTGGWQRLRELKRIMGRYGAPGWSPGAIAYGLDTLRKQHPILFGPSSAADVERFRRHPLARLLSPLHRLVVLLIDRQISHAQGLTRDGLASRVCRLAIARGPEPVRVVLRGELVGDHSSPFGLELRCGGVVFRSEQGRDRQFEVSMDLPAVNRDDRHALEIEVCCSRAALRQGRHVFRLRSIEAGPLAQN